MNNSMTSDPTWRTEMVRLSPWLLDQRVSATWHVPAGYFDHLPDTLLQQLAPQDDSLPIGYFDQLPKQVMQRIRAEVEEDPILDLPIIKQPFQVPHDYFDQLPDRVLPKAKKHTSRIVRFQRRWQTVAVAAAMLAAVVAGYLTWQPTLSEDNQLSMADLSAQELSDYLASNLEDWNSDQLLELSDQEFWLFMDSTATEQLENWVIEDVDIEDLEELL